MFLTHFFSELTKLVLLIKKHTPYRVFSCHGSPTCFELFFFFSFSFFKAYSGWIKKKREGGIKKKKKKKTRRKEGMGEESLGKLVTNTAGSWSGTGVERGDRGV